MLMKWPLNCHSIDTVDSSWENLSRGPLSVIHFHKKGRYFLGFNHTHQTIELWDIFTIPLLTSIIIVPEDVFDFIKTNNLSCQYLRISDSCRLVAAIFQPRSSVHVDDDLSLLQVFDITLKSTSSSIR